MVFQLDDELWFPDPHFGEEDGLVAVGGDLSVDRLLLAYSNGFFPWYAFQMQSEPHWYCPLDRYVIFPNEIHISHSMRQLLRQNKYKVTVNQDFEGVIHGCSTAQERDEEAGAWLGPDIIKAYTELHSRGYAVTLGKAFFGESMFSLVPNASKLALIHLAKTMVATGGHFIDCQFETPHFKSMGGRHITYEQYMKLIRPRSGTSEGRFKVDESSEQTQ